MLWQCCEKIMTQSRPVSIVKAEEYKINSSQNIQKKAMFFYFYTSNDAVAFGARVFLDSSHEEENEIQQLNSYQSEPCCLFPSSLRSLYWPLGLGRHTGCSSLLAALLSFMDVLQFSLNVFIMLSVFTRL